ncbi:SHOCT domain-containing protein [Haloprofundus salinisoli]|uniref:SHOCT domain-containing protein n=1 Tax=Haloprofundus salinisoli TaxID=2876193 RepID=UPI001CCE992A|nr:SHOCT domain-containing protein [Haloprofundus salinisoli]
MAKNRISRRPADPDDEDDESPLEQVVAGVVIALIFLVGFGLLALGNPWFWVAFPVGFAGLLPAAIGLARWYEHRRERDETERGHRSESEADDIDRALATLRERYARGELDEEAFEYHLERLLSTETTGDARSELRRRRESASATERELEETEN